MKQSKYDKYLEDIKTLRQNNIGDGKIAKILKIPKEAVRLIRSKNHIPRIEYIQPSIQLTKRQVSQIIGMVLGDAYLSNKYKSSYINFAHSLKQEEYFYHKVKILENLSQTQCKKISKLDKRNNKVYEKNTYTSKSFKELKNLRDIFYPDGKKIIPIEFIKTSFTEESLAYLYMDDGNYTKYSTTIATCNFELDNLKEFISFLKSKFDLDCTILGNKSIRIKQKSVKKFFELINPYISQINCMSYKSPH